MRPLYTAEQSHKVDQMLIEQTPIAGYELMQRAGRVCFSHLIKHWPQARSIIVYTGIGNNGGDGYIIAELLHRAGRQVKVCQLGDINNIKGDALQARNAYFTAGGERISIDQTIEADLLVDAIFGNGLNRALSEQALAWIEQINRLQLPVIAVDIPSGLDADRGCARPIAVNADITVSLITRKRGMYTADGKNHCGQIIFEDLQSQSDIVAQIEPDCQLLNHDEAIKWLPPRRRNTHKKDFGHVLIIGGNQGMAGAVCLAGKAALCSGAGLVSVLSHAQNSTAVTMTCPPLMAHDVACPKTTKKLINHCNIVVIGPGLGVDAWALALMAKVLDSDKPLIVDADALHLLAKDPLKSKRWILTPHPGEAAHLLHTTTREIQQDRFAAAQNIHTRYGGVCVLKGAGTIVANGEQTVVCEGGNSAMSSAGMGDVLSGVIASLQGQGLSRMKAALLGTCAHARAGDLAAVKRARGISAEVVIEHLPATITSGYDDF